MSAHTRQAFRAAVTAAADPTPYYETVGAVVDLNRAADTWVTLEFPQTQSDRVSLGYPACMRETGAVFLHVLARSGVGDTEVIDLAESIRAKFFAPYLGDIRIIGTQAPFLFPADDGEWLDCVTQIAYSWDYVVAAV